MSELAIAWPEMPQAHDYRAAEGYPLLALELKQVKRAVHEPRRAKHTRARKANRFCWILAQR